MKIFTYSLAEVKMKVDNSVSIHTSAQTRILTKYSHVSTIVRLHHLNFSEKHRKNLNWNYLRTLLSVFKKSWKQHTEEEQFYGYLPPISLTIPAGHAGYC